MNTYTTTNLRIESKSLKKMKFVALQENKSVSALLRELIEKYTSFASLGADMSVCSEKKKRYSLSDLTTIQFKGKDKNLSANIDKIAYGA